MEEESNIKEQQQQMNSSTRDNASQSGEITENITSGDEYDNYCPWEG